MWYNSDDVRTMVVGHKKIVKTLLLAALLLPPQAIQRREKGYRRMIGKWVGGRISTVREGENQLERRCVRVVGIIEEHKSVYK